jgi:hypothetical protein
LYFQFRRNLEVESPVRLPGDLIDKLPPAVSFGALQDDTQWLSRSITLYLSLEDVPDRIRARSLETEEQLAALTIRFQKMAGLCLRQLRVEIADKVPDLWLLLPFASVALMVVGLGAVSLSWQWLFDFPVFES